MDPHQPPLLCSQGPDLPKEADDDAAQPPHKSLDLFSRLLSIHTKLSLDLFIKPCPSLTGELVPHTDNPHTSPPLVLVSKLHGQSEAVEEHESVLMVASRFSITVLLPYLKQLIHSYNTCMVCMCWIYRV
jgi:hypothetical protein